MDEDATAGSLLYCFYHTHWKLIVPIELHVKTVKYFKSIERVQEEVEARHAELRGLREKGLLAAAGWSSHTPSWAHQHYAQHVAHQAEGGAGATQSANAQSVLKGLSSGAHDGKAKYEDDVQVGSME